MEDEPNLPKQNALMQRQPKPSDASDAQTMKTLTQLVRQSFDVFQVYGKSPESITNAVMAFWEVLRPYPESKIISAFKIWMNDEDRLPTPSDIKKKIQMYEPTRSYAPYVEADLAQSLLYTPLPYLPRGEWDTLDAQEKACVRRHMEHLVRRSWQNKIDALHTFRCYCRDWLKWPNDFVEQVGFMLEAK